MRILFTSPVLEHPAAGGPQLRIENSIKALAQVCELDIISRSPPAMSGGQTAEDFYHRYCKEFHVAPVTRRLSANRYVRRLQRILLGLWQRDIMRDADYILDHVERRGIDTIWFGYGNISYPLIRRIKALRPRLKVVCDTDSVWSRFVTRELPYARGLRKLRILRAGRKKEVEERAWVNLCDVTTAVSEVDADYYRNLAANKSRVHLFSNVIDVEDYAHIPEKPAHFSAPAIFLAGSFWKNSPMEQATRWFINDVYPSVVEEVPSVHFYIIGRGSSSILSDLKQSNITVTGMLPSVLPYLCHSRVAVVPLKFESGTRFKILEAGACKIAIVSTTLGAEGIPVIDGEHILFADEPREFANAILRLLDDTALAKKLALNCHQLVTQRFSVASLSIEAKKILDYLHHD